ncbi:TauD/TfdA family dioxygenase [Labedaea rhizosphaerae]|uniref:TfdA family taurine catabolism dioxygenase TauD n=1 Tax=Labedaea rhizosphaerae TaxID=598644 RepID=A0A4R6SEX5_LABRH|nr:TauD/TfdA family dioxygenase [Labedaea rhizosphaerae]TDQ00512.1 TfdA family taurine catabolism dioxygenase TauD [Labedaea rhizosphaerae]
MATTTPWAPKVIRPEDIGTDASGAGLKEHLHSLDLEAMLVEHKALVWRGFGIARAEFDAVVDALLPTRWAYRHGNSPRTKVGDNIYTSTEYPAEHTISMHNELSYAKRYPSRLVFYCEQAAATGGATPVVDGAAWLAALDDEVREAYRGGVRYRQNLHGGHGFGKSWQETFETDDRAEVEQFLAGTGAEWEWRDDDRLRIEQPGPSTVVDPRTGTEVWFNQSDQWHAASLGDETAKALAAIMAEEDMPQSVAFADGSPIPAEYVIQVRDRGLATAVDVDWAQGDLMVIDNVLTGHGRRPFTGQRRVLVAMAG